MTAALEQLSMSSVTALGHLRSYMRVTSAGLDQALRVVPNSTSDRAAHDYHGAAVLNAFLEADLDFEDLPTALRSLVLNIALRERPHWMSAARSGRDYVRPLLSANLEDVLVNAELFDDAPSIEVVEWWDRVASFGWSELDARRLAQGRGAERRSYEREVSRLDAEGCPFPVRWVSLDDNQAGYDIASWERVGTTWSVALVEVKSTSGTVPQFFLSRPEFNACVSARSLYRIHVWTSGERLCVVDRDFVMTGAPADGAASEWREAYFRLDDSVQAAAV